MRRIHTVAVVALASLPAVVACSSSSGNGNGGGNSGDGGGGASSSGGGGGSSSSGGASSSGASSSSGGTTMTNPANGVPAGNPDAGSSVPAAGQAEDVSNPTTVVGTGTPVSCTGDAFVAAVAKGGVITFACGPDPT